MRGKEGIYVSSIVEQKESPINIPYYDQLCVSQNPCVESLTTNLDVDCVHRQDLL